MARESPRVTAVVPSLSPEKEPGGPVAARPGDLPGNRFEAKEAALTNAPEPGDATVESQCGNGARFVAPRTGGV